MNRFVHEQILYEPRIIRLKKIRGELFMNIMNPFVDNTNLVNKLMIWIISGPPIDYKWIIWSENIMQNCRENGKNS